MSTELALNMRCVILNGGIEKWITEHQAKLIQDAVESNQKFIQLGDEMLSTYSIVGIFTPATLEERSRRKNGEWQCKYGYWHDRGNECGHAEKLPPIKGTIDEVSGRAVYKAVQSKLTK